jgi:hypothetical protein
MRKDPKLTKRVNYAKYGYIFSLPFVLAFLIFQLYPLIFTTTIGFTNMQGTEMLGVGIMDEDVTFTWNTIVDSGSTLQMRSTVEPSDATNRSVTWSVEPGTGDASIDENGLLTARDAGSVTVRATANDDSEIFQETEITIYGSIVHVSAINLSGANNIRTITSNNDNLRIHAEFSPAEPTNQNLTWTLIPVTGGATITPSTREPSALISATANGTVIVRATADDGSDVFGEIEVTISGQTVQAIAKNSISLTGENGVTSINENGGTLQLNAAIHPHDATNQNLTWTVIQRSGNASVNNLGVLTARANGNVIVRATSAVDPTVYDEIEITISGQASESIPVESIAVVGLDDRTTIYIDGGTLRPFHWFTNVFNSDLFRKFGL